MKRKVHADPGASSWPRRDARGLTTSSLTPAGPTQSLGARSCTVGK